MSAAVPVFDDLEEMRWARRKLEHENDLVNHRLSWLASSQALLAAVYVIRFGTGNDAPEGLGVWIPALGIASTLLVYVSIGAAIAAFHLTVSCWAGDDPERRRRLLTGNTVTQWLGFIAPAALPGVLITGWLFALAYELD